MIELITEDRMKSEFVRILIKFGFNNSRAEQCAGIFTLNSLEGVYSHGVNRFPRFVEYIIKGYVRPDSNPSLTGGAGSVADLGDVARSGRRATRESRRTHRVDRRVRALDPRPAERLHRREADVVEHEEVHHVAPPAVLHRGDGDAHHRRGGVDHNRFTGTQ